ncbi:MAG: 3-hydroxyacyl-CoA dehydrogenase NAD-binding domain-containing protein, partial [Pseudonocardiaceae bacterium]
MPLPHGLDERITIGAEDAGTDDAEEDMSADMHSRQRRNVEFVGVIGGGTMGAGIAEVCIKAGSSVLILETKPEFAEAAQARIEKSLARGVKAGKLDQEAADAALARVRVTLDIDDFADRDLVIEAAPEIESLKIDIFQKLDKVVKPSGILASNTSSIPLIKMANATQRPGQVVGVHF